MNLLFLCNVYFSLRDLLRSTPLLKMGKAESPCFFHNGRVSVPLLRTTLLTRRFSIVTRDDREVSSEQEDESVERCASVGILSSNTGWLMRRRGLRSHSWLEPFKLGACSESVVNQKVSENERARFRNRINPCANNTAALETLISPMVSKK